MVGIDIVERVVVQDLHPLRDEDIVYPEHVEKPVVRTRSSRPLLYESIAETVRHPPVSERRRRIVEVAAYDNRIGRLRNILRHQFGLGLSLIHISEPTRP